MGKLLVVEDSKMLCKIFQELLEKYTDFDFEIAQTFAEAKELVSKHRYEYAVADMNLPDAKSGEIIALLNRHNISPIVFTGNFDEEFRESFESASIVDYILKERYENIMHVIEKLLQLQANKLKTVLIVDDSSLYSKFLKSNLHIHHFRVLYAANGKEALEKLQEHPEIELVITDYHMPVMDGLEFVRRVRKQRDKKSLAILVLTSDTNSYTTSRFLKEGANDYITKPFSRDEFYARIYHNIETIDLFGSMMDDYQDNIIELISEIVEFKSTETCSHIKRISKYSYLLAKLSGAFEGEAQVISKMAVLHDVGKIVVPEAILCKPDKFTPQEYEEMKKHTIEGYNIMRTAFESDPRAGKIAMDIVKYHHEKWDGTGYPEGLSKEEIPFAARIVAISDVFDALVSKRAYKEPWSIQDAAQYIKNNAATHFDPKLAKLFIKHISSFVAIYEQINEEKAS